MKKIFLLITALTGLAYAFAAQAALDGPYIGIVGGYADTHYIKRDLAVSQGGGELKLDGHTGTISGNTSIFNTTEALSGVRESGIFGRIFTGYQFNEFSAAEIGYAKFTDGRWREGDGDVLRAKTQAFDLLAKFQYPVARHFYATAKIGAAYMISGLDFSGPLNIGSLLVNGSIRHHTLQQFTVAYGAGLSYDVTPQISVEGSYLRYHQTADIAPADMVGAGVVYHFA